MFRINKIVFIWCVKSTKSINSINIFIKPFLLPIKRKKNMAIDVAFPSPVLFFQSTLDGAKLDGNCVTDPNTVTQFPKIL